MRDILVEADQLQMDLSSLGSIIAITLLCLMILGVFPHRLDVQTLVSPDSFDDRLTGY